MGKKCRDCQQIKPENEFTTNYGYKDHKQPYCNECNNKRQREYYRLRKIRYNSKK